MKIINYKRPVIVGIFILLGIIILIVAIFTLGGQKKTFVKSFTIHAVFNDVGGLLNGSNIWFSGVKIGTVKKITFYGDSQVQVTMSIEQDAEKHIHKDAKAKIGSDGLIGNKIVIIYGGTPSKPQVEKNDFLTVDKAISTDEMLATLQVSNKNLLDITNEFRTISQKINSGKGTLGVLLNDQTIGNNLKNTVDSLKATIANFKTASVSTKNVLASLQDFSHKLNKHGNLLSDMASDTTMYRSIKGSLAQLQNATNEVNQFSTKLKTLGNRLNQKDNAVGVLLNDPATAEDMKTTLRNLASGSKKLDEDLEAVQHNFLFRGFFRKKEKNEPK